jgi:hypothetical protein
MSKHGFLGVEGADAHVLRYVQLPFENVANHRIFHFIRAELLSRLDGYVAYRDLLVAGYHRGAVVQVHPRHAFLGGWSSTSRRGRALGIRIKGRFATAAAPTPRMAVLRSTRSMILPSFGIERRAHTTERVRWRPRNGINASAVLRLGSKHPRTFVRHTPQLSLDAFEYHILAVDKC